MQETLQETETEHVGAPLPAAAPDVSRLRAAWTLLKQAVVGTEQDYTEGSLNKAVFLLSVPMILEMVMESVFGVLDVYFVGRLGADAVAAVGLTESLLTIVFAVAIGLSMSVTALVARRIGEKDPEQAARTAVQAIALGVVTSLPFALAALWTRPLMGLMGAPAVRDRRGLGLHGLDAGRQRLDHAAVPDQRDLPRRRRRDRRDALALARERRQHRARPLPDLRARPVPRARRDGRRDRHDDRPRRWASRISCARSARRTGGCGSSAGTCGSTAP